MHRVVTQDVTWVQHFDSEAKKQSMQLKAPWLSRTHPSSNPRKKFKRVSSAGKVEASILWESQDIIRVDYL